jgi:type-F conjugative transfer system pilin assembly protein TrbC
MLYSTLRKRVSCLVVLVLFSSVSFYPLVAMSEAKGGVPLSSKITRQLTSRQRAGVNAALSMKARLLHPPHFSAMRKLARPIQQRAKRLIKGTLQTEAKQMYSSAPKAQGHFYFFMSFSMPMPLIKKLITDAVALHGVVVFRGTPNKMSLKDFLLKKLFPLVRYSQQHVEIDLNPNLFQSFQVSVVPSLVFTMQTKTVCHAAQESVSRPLQSSPCDQVDGSRYWKVTGAVTTQWAIAHFIEKGAPLYGWLLKLNAFYAEPTPLRFQVLRDLSARAS